MSRAEDVIAETLNGHEMVRLIGDPRKPTGYLCVGCGTETEPHHAARLQHRATAVIEAIRNLSPDDLAELIGGRVQLKSIALGLNDTRGDKSRVVGPWQEIP